MLEVLLLYTIFVICYVFYIFNQELNKSSQHREKWKFLLLIPGSIFKVFMSCVLGYILLILKNCCPRRDNLELRNFYDWKSVALDIENLLLFPRNPFHATHPEEYRWFQGGPREILGVLKCSEGSRRLEEISRVVGVRKI